MIDEEVPYWCLVGESSSKGSSSLLRVIEKAGAMIADNVPWTVRARLSGHDRCLDGKHLTLIYR